LIQNAKTVVNIVKVEKAVIIRIVTFKVGFSTLYYEIKTADNNLVYSIKVYISYKLEF